MIALEKSRVELAAEIVLSNDGTILFEKDDRTLGALGYLHGQGSMRWSQLHSALSHRQEHMDNQQEAARTFVVAGVEGRQPDQFSTPNDIVAQSEPVDVMAPVNRPTMANRRPAQGGARTASTGVRIMTGSLTTTSLPGDRNRTPP